MSGHTPAIEAFLARCDAKLAERKQEWRDAKKSCPRESPFISDQMFDIREVRDDAEKVMRALVESVTKLPEINGPWDECLICGKPVFGYDPQMCCSGFECGCMGQPMNPCVCSEACANALYENIGMAYEARRIKCGIAKWVANPPLPIASAKDAPTPETDAAVKKMWNATINHLSDVVMGYVSRSLEQRLFASRAECERLRTALQFYGDIEDYKSPLTGGMGKLYFDCGQTARTALQP